MALAREDIPDDQETGGRPGPLPKGHPQNPFDWHAIGGINGLRRLTNSFEPVERIRVIRPFGLDDTTPVLVYIAPQIFVRFRFDESQLGEIEVTCSIANALATLDKTGRYIVGGLAPLQVDRGKPVSGYLIPAKRNPYAKASQQLVAIGDIDKFEKQQSESQLHQRPGRRRV